MRRPASEVIVSMEQTEEPPADFVTYAEPSPYLDRIGPLFQRRAGAGVQFGIRIGEHHCNRRGMAHGGLVVALADVALGKTGEWLSQPPVTLLTVSLTVDFYGSARCGEWLEAETDVTRVGHRVAFGNCYLRVGDKIVARASGVFNVRPSTPNVSG
jgi:acyl-coenzyme A thioesterase 13